MITLLLQGWPREGVYIDPIAKALRESILNPLLVMPVAITVYCWSSMLSLTLPTVATNLINIAALLSIVLPLNDYLSTWTRNNWTKADPWDATNEIVVVTGGCSGIGASTVERLIPRAKTVVVLDITPLPKYLQAENVVYYKTNLSIAEEIQTVCVRIRDEVGHPTTLVNNAGLSRGKTLTDGSYHDVQITLQTNLQAPFLLVKEFLPHMIAQNHGHILSVSSMSAIIPPAGLADYAATKLGMLALHEAMELELKHTHKASKVRSSVAILSFVKTPLFKGETDMTFLTPLMHVDTVGDAIVETLCGGVGKIIFYPGVLRYLTWIRGSPEWFQRRVRDGTASLRVDFTGRQEIDPSTGKLKE